MIPPAALPVNSTDFYGLGMSVVLVESTETT